MSNSFNISVLPDIAVLQALHDVPATDSTDDVHIRDVIGKKDDTGDTTPGINKSSMAYLKGIMEMIVFYTGNVTTLHTVAVADDTANAHMSDVAGNKTDALKTSIDGISSLMAYGKGAIDRALSDKEKAFIGRAGQHVLNEYFQNVDEAAVPDVSIWNVTEDNDADVVINYNVVPSYCRLHGGTGATDDCVIFTNTNLYWDANKYGVTTIHWKSRIKASDLTGEWAIGLHNETMIPTADLYDNGVNNVAGFKCNNDVVLACSSDGVLESNDVTAYFSDNAWVDLEVRWTKANVIFLIDDTIRATHVTRRPQKALQYILATKNTNGITTDLYSEYNEVWPE